MIIRSFLWLISPAMVVVVLLAGCAKTPSADRTLEHLRMQAEERLLQDARVAFFQGQYQETALLLERFVMNHPRSRLIDEARWWLARSHQQHGDLSAALMRYRQLAQGRHPNPYRNEATLRVAEIELILGVNLDTHEFVGVMIGAGVLLQPNGLDFATNYRDKVFARAVAIDFPCWKPSTEDSPGNSPIQGVRMWDRILDEGIKPLVHLGKEQGFGVWVGVPLRCMGAYYDASEEQTRRWSDQTYDVSTGRIQRSEGYSLFSAEYRDVVFSLLSQVAELRVDGVVFRATASQGPYEGFTPLAIRAFEQQFGERLTPEMLFTTSSQGEVITSSHLLNQRASVSVDYPPLFWKWAGWKAREGIRLMNELAVNLRSQFPYIKIALEVHPESIEDPLSALVNVSEDWIEMSHGEFDVIVTNLHDAPSVRVRSGTTERVPVGRSERTVALVTGMVDYLRKAERVWVIQSNSRTLPLHDRGDRLNTDLPKGVGILYDYTAVP